MDKANLITGGRLPRLFAATIWLAALAAQPALAQTLLIGNKGEDTVSFIDLPTGKERARTATGKAPHEIAISPDGKQAAVVAYGGASIDLFDVTTAALVKRIDIAPNVAPHGVAWLRNGLIISTAEASQALAIIDPKTGTVGSVSTGQVRSHMLVVSPDQRTAYVANIGSGTISVIDLKRRTKLRDIDVGGMPEGIAITRDGKQLWVGDNGKPQVRIVDIASGQTVASLPADSIAFRVTITPDGRTAATSNLLTGTINLYDVAARKPLRTITVSGAPDTMQVTLIFTPDSRRALVAETMKDRVAEVDLASGQVLRRIAGGKNGDGLGIGR